MENHKARSKSREAIEVNQTLDACRTILHNMYREIFEKDNYVTAEKLKNSYLGISTDSTMILVLFRDLIKDIEALVNITKPKATLQKYKVTYTRISEFMEFKYNISELFTDSGIEPLFVLQNTVTVFLSELLWIL